MMNQHDSQDQSAGCRFCGTPLKHTFVHLGMSPPCERILRADQLNEMEPFYPLHVFVCDQCFLVQLQEYISPDEIFSDEYAYYSSYSDSWLKHAKTYTEMITERLDLGPDSKVVELASNDGYLLQYFVQKGIPVLGVEPAANVAEAALEKGVPSVVRFFGEATARDIQAEHAADLIIGNNVLAHVPDINDFVKGMQVLLKPHGVVTMEFPHLMRLIEQNQFDTIYHEHFSYLSLIATNQIFAAHGLTIFDVQELPSHGGSLRIFARHTADTGRPIEAAVTELIERERAIGTMTMEYYVAFDEQVKRTKRDLLSFLINARAEGKTVAGYGAPGKGNTLLNYCGIREDFLDYTVDRNPHKHGKYLPGTHIPIFAPDHIDETRPDYVLILPWNLKKEIMAQMAHIREWGGQFVVPIPQVEVLA